MAALEHIVKLSSLFSAGEMCCIIYYSLVSEEACGACCPAALTSLAIANSPSLTSRVPRTKSERRRGGYRSAQQTNTHGRWEQMIHAVLDQCINDFVEQSVARYNLNRPRDHGSTPRQTHAVCCSRRKKYRRTEHMVSLRSADARKASKVDARLGELTACSPH